MSGDNKGQTGPMGGQMGGLGSKGRGGVKRRVVCPLPLLLLLLLLLRGLTLSAGCQKKRETLSLSEDGLEQQRGVCHRRTFCDFLPECTWLCCAEVQLLLSHLFYPLQCPDAAPLTHTLSFCQREVDDGQVKATVSCFLSFL